jgi:CBS domain-containing protein
MKEVTEIPLTGVINPEFDTILPETPLESIFAQFAEQRCDDLVVVDPEGRFLGVIAALDLLATVGPIVGLRSMKRSSCIECLVKTGISTAADVMRRGHITIAKDRTVGDAIRIMEKNRHPYLFAIEGDGKVIGKIAVCDIIAHLRVVGHL